MSFKALEKRTREGQNKKGFCHLLPKHYAAIDGVETRNNKVVKRQVHWICERYPNGYTFILLDGVTGHESWYVNDLVETLSIPTDCEFFPACLGCSNYPKLELNLSQVKRVIMELNSQFH